MFFIHKEPLNFDGKQICFLLIFCTSIKSQSFLGGCFDLREECSVQYGFYKEALNVDGE